MKTITLSSGSQVPVLGFGTWQLTPEECLNSVSMALDIGYRHIDTAQAYGNEAEVGTALRQSGVARENVFVTTKISRANLAEGNVINSAEQSLRSLQMDYVDLLLVHWPLQEMPFEQTLEDFATLQQQGKARNIGISNFTVAQMRRVVEELGINVATNQVEYHPFLGQSAVLEYCLSHNMFLTAYCPLARGEALASAELQAIGQAHGKTATQVALRWLIQQQGVVAIPRSRSQDHIQSNFDIFDFELSQAEMERINLLPKDHRLVNPPFAPQWDNAA